MPLVNADVKSLEIAVAADLSNDSVLKQELWDKADIHENNRQAFGLPSRLIAKVFVFRLLYGGSAYSYANDPDFKEVSTDEKFWQGVIDQYYEKYQGIAKWHKRLIETAQKEGKIQIPSGRYFPIKPDKNYRGELKWPLTVIKNYPVQGMGNDLVKLARLEALRRIEKSGLEAILVCTIHDSIVADCPSKNVTEVGRILFQSIERVPELCKSVWNYEFKVPLTSEVQFGPNKFNMEDLKIT